MLPQVTVIVPAFNEAATLADTLLSLRQQSIPIAEVIVVDDCSTDGTAAIARAHGATVLRPPSNTGSKAGAQTFALPRVITEFVVAVDADTTLAPDALEQLMKVFSGEEGLAAACGFAGGTPSSCAAPSAAFQARSNGLGGGAGGGSYVVHPANIQPLTMITAIHARTR